ncbi:MAG: hypothetical protein IPJ84_15205 [Bdellovibrionales bacterium]|nr:hypothetical protein [Bdellovibrionales bacterium]
MKRGFAKWAYAGVVCCSLVIPMERASSHVPAKGSVSEDLSAASAIDYFNDAIAAADSGDMKLAEALYLRAIDLDSKLYQAHANLARLRFGDGRLKMAEQGYRSALRIRPDDAIGILGLARVEARKKRFGAALKLAESCLGSDIKIECMMARAHYLDKLGRYLESYQQYVKVTQLDRLYSDAYRSQCVVGARAERIDLVEESYAKWLEAMPSDPGRKFMDDLIGRSR